MTSEESYLWDRNEPQDAFVAKLERCLTPRRNKVKKAGLPRGPRFLRVVGSVALDLI